VVYGLAMAPRHRRSMPGVVRHAVLLITASILALSSGAAPAAASGATSGATSGASAASTASGASAATLPPLPARWPSTNLEIGLMDSPGGASALHASGAYKFRYQYLCGGVNTGSGWSTWDSDGTFATRYVDESVAAGITPVFIYYQMLQSKPGIDDLNAKVVTESQADLENLRNTSTMRSYWADVRLMFQRLGTYSQAVVIDVEPDLWGYIEQASTGDNAATVPAAVASSGDADVAGFANNAAGFAQAFVKLRNQYAPNVILGYHMSTWGTLNDPISQDIPLDQIDALADRSAAFEISTGASFDVGFGDPSDRDAAFKQYIYGDGGNSWWSADDYARWNRWMGRFTGDSGLRMVLWQIPLGNTKMRAMNNTWGHYQDNHVETWLGDGASANLAATVDSGVIALLFGGGADGTTAAADTMGDGVTNPAAIDGNTTASYSADDDGGYFRHQTKAYYSAGAMPLPSTGAIPPTPTTYHALSPARILDTRVNLGITGALRSHVAQSFTVRGRGGVPVEATAVTGNLTVTQQTSLGFLYVGPNSINDPTSSTLNFPKGDDRANAVTVALSADGRLWVTYAAPVRNTPTAQVVFDVTGYFTPDTTGATYHPIAPTRILDTRTNQGIAGSLRSHQAQGFAVRGQAGVPSDAVAVTGNLTVTGQSSLGYLYVGPSPADNPTSSTLNFPLGDDRANAVTVELSGDGKLYVTFAAPSLGPTAHAIFDVTGYFTDGGGGSAYVPLTPFRILDTRSNRGIVGALRSHAGQGFTVAGTGGVPSTATAVTGNLTVTQQSSLGYLYVGPQQADNPTSSTLNFPVADDRANAVTVAVGTDGKLWVTYAAPTYGPTAHAIFDVTGYFIAP
jgi:hypothetical protein